MPDPFLYLQAMAVAAIAGAVTMFVAAWFATSPFAPQKFTAAHWLNPAAAVAVVLGLMAGYVVMQLRTGWPPANALDRLLLILLPCLFLLEIAAGLPQLPRVIAWGLRCAFAAAAPAVLLYGSVYLSGSEDYPFVPALLQLAVAAGLLIAVWGGMAWLSHRRPGVTLPVAVCMAVQAAGAAIMLAGYIQGGAAAIPLVGVVLAVAVVARIYSIRTAPVLLSVAVASLFCLLFTGAYFGEISTTCALVLLASPLLCWLTELPLLPRRPWLIGTLQIVLVAIPLVIVLVLAKQAFDRDMAPLLGRAPAVKQPLQVRSAAAPASLRDFVKGL